MHEYAPPGPGWNPTRSACCRVSILTAQFCGVPDSFPRQWPGVTHQFQHINAHPDKCEIDLTSLILARTRGYCLRPEYRPAHYVWDAVAAWQSRYQKRNRWESCRFKIRFQSGWYSGYLLDSHWRWSSAYWRAAPAQPLVVFAPRFEHPYSCSFLYSFYS